MWVTDTSFAADWLLWPGTFTSPNLSFLICGMRWLEWIIYKVLSRGAGGQMSFPSVWLPSGQSSQPSPPPQLCRKLWRMGQAYVSLFQVLCVEWGCSLWWTGLFLWAVFYLHCIFLHYHLFFNGGSFTKLVLLSFENHSMSPCMESGGYSL